MPTPHRAHGNGAPRSGLIQKHSRFSTRPALSTCFQRIVQARSGYGAIAALAPERIQRHRAGRPQRVVGRALDGAERGVVGRRDGTRVRLALLEELHADALAAIRRQQHRFAEVEETRSVPAARQERRLHVGAPRRPSGRQEEQPTASSPSNATTSPAPGRRRNWRDSGSRSPASRRTGTASRGTPRCAAAPAPADTAASPRPQRIPSAIRHTCPFGPDATTDRRARPAWSN